MQKLNFNFLSFFLCKRQLYVFKAQPWVWFQTWFRKITRIPTVQFINHQKSRTHDKMVIEHSLIRHPSQSSICDPPPTKNWTKVQKGTHDIYIWKWRTEERKYIYWGPCVESLPLAFHVKISYNSTKSCEKCSVFSIRSCIRVFFVQLKNNYGATQAPRRHNSQNTYILYFKLLQQGH